MINVSVELQINWSAHWLLSTTVSIDRKCLLFVIGRVYASIRYHFPPWHVNVFTRIFLLVNLADTVERQLIFNRVFR